MKFKIGDKVELLEDYWSNRKKGDKFTITSREGGFTNDMDLYSCVSLDDPNVRMGVFGKRLKLAEKTLDDLEVGDILLDSDGDEVKVLAICNEIIGISEYDDFDTFNKWLTISEIKNRFTLKQDLTAKITELTLEDVAKLAGKDVSQIKIVK